MKRKIFSLMVVVMLVASVFTLAGCGGGSTSGDGGDVIKIGALGPYTGDTASYGTAALAGIELAVAHINENGGVDGKQVELISYDTKGDATEAVNAYNRLRDQDEVVAIVGPVLSGESLAVKDLAKEDNMPMISPTATADDVTVGAANSFRVCYLDAYQGIAAANYSVDGIQAKNAAILVSKGNAYSEGLAAAFTAKFEEKGGKIVGTESYAEKDTDFSAQLTKIKDLNPEVIFVPDYYSTVGPILQKAKELGITAKFIGGDGWDSVQEEYAEVAEGAFFANHYAADSPKESVQAFIKAYKENNEDKAPNSFAALGYDAMNVTAMAISNADSTEKDAIISALATVEQDGVTGKFSFDEDGNPKGKEITIVEIKGGELTFVTTVAGE